MIDENKGNYWYCKYCGSNKGTWFSRVIPMGNFCEDCGKCADEDSDEFGQDLNRESIPNSTIDYNAENAQEKDLVLRQWMQDVTSLLCYQPEVPHAHKESLVKALDHYIKLNNHQCQKPPNNPSPL